MKQFFQKYKNLILQFIKFNLVGILNTLIDFAVFTLLDQVLTFSYLPAKILSYSCGLVNSYLLNTKWTFRAKNRWDKRQMIRFLLVNLLALGASLLVLFLCSDILHWQNDILSNCIATPVSILINFIGNRLFVFRQGKESR